MSASPDPDRRNWTGSSSRSSTSSPYLCGKPSKPRDYFWDVRMHELGEIPEQRKTVPMERKGSRPVISKTHVHEWIPHGYVVDHSSSPGTGLSQGCPTIGGDNEPLAPMAVIDWLNGLAAGFTSIDGDDVINRRSLLRCLAIRFLSIHCSSPRVRRRSPH